MNAKVVRAVSGPLDAVVRVPGSKSVANRALVCAMLAQGESVISGLPDGDDTAVILNVLRETNRLQQLDDSSVVISGRVDGALPGIVDAVLAGTSSRFLTAVAALGEGTTIIDGGEPLRGRPMHDLHQALVDMGADVTPLGEWGHLPVSISRGMCVGGDVEISGDVSSQFISALMLIAPVLLNGLRINVVGDLISRSYVEMTALVMRTFGASVEINDASIVIASTGYEATNYVVEPDYSSAAFPIAALLIRGGRLRIPSLATSRMQGDSAMADIAQAMGAVMSTDGDDVLFERGEMVPLSSLTMNMSDCSDLVPAVVAACAVAEGTSVLTGIGFIRHKESDRLGDLASELNKTGAKVQVDSDGLTIHGVTELKSASFETHHDHRLAMALALTALAAPSAEVVNPEVVTKSWPSYFRDMQPILGS